ncbi:MAG: VOC family protein, partial [bacterium]
GDCETVSFELAGHAFRAISAGPTFKFNPSISFILNFDPMKDSAARESLDRTWKALAGGGTVLMPLDRYPFSERYGWIQDRFGLSWQLLLSQPSGEERPFILPSLMFTGSQAGKAAEAVAFYTSVFSGSGPGRSQAYGAGMEPDRPESLAFSDFHLGGQWFAAMDSARPRDWAFNEAVSLLVPCESQREIDDYWSKLAVDPERGQCGWTKDRFGVSWQVGPTALGAMLSSPDEAAVARVTKAFLKMRKLDLAKLRASFEGR